MAEYTRPSGVQLDIPETFQLEESRPKPRGRAPGGLPRGPVPLASTGPTDDGSDPLVAALQNNGLDVVDVIPLAPTPQGAGARAIAGSQAATITVPVNEDEAAALLIEQDGVYSWNLPETVEAGAPAAPRARGLAPGRKLYRFRLEAHSQPPTGPVTRSGLLQKLVIGRLKAFVLKFAAKLIVKEGVEYLERDSREQLLLVDSLDPAAWRAAETRNLSLPSDRPARILLLVHGTFSSTIGSFGGLATTPWGQQFIEAVRANYDAALGFDHFTLKRDPAANAETLRRQLEAIAWPMPPQIDAIAFSRGGLVLRSAMDASASKLRIRRAVFVACTNDGTILASPDNWKVLIDLYTNLAMAAFHLMQMLPNATGVALILNQFVQTISSLVKYMVTTAATDKTVPGLAAMKPGGEFLNKLHHDDSAGLLRASNYVITSEFAPVISGPQAEPKEIPARLLSAIAGGLITELMREGNDLVVNASSMATLERSAHGLVHDRFDFGKTAKVYHTTYFLRPEVVNALTRWLALVSPAELTASKGVAAKASPAEAAKTTGIPGEPALRSAPRSPGSRFRGAGSRTRGAPSGAALPSTPVARAAVSRGVELPASVDQRVVVAHAETPMADVIETIRDSPPSYVVVQRNWGGQMLHYALPTERVLTASTAPPGLSIRDALQLHETDASPEASLSDTASSVEAPAVVLSHDRVLGVVAPVQGSSTDIVDLANAVLNPADQASAAAASRAMPVFRPSPAATATLFLRAEMDESLMVNKATSVDVTLSREALGGASGAAQGEASGEAQLQHKIAVQLIARSQFTVLGKDRYELDIPEADQPWLGSFDVKPTHTGRGELWAVLSQGPATLATVILTPTVVDKSVQAGRIVSRGSGSEQPAAPAIDQLLIIEQRNGNEVKLFFQLESFTLNLLNSYESKPLVGKREDYVKNLYEQIEQRWLSNQDDVANFTSEMRELGTDLLSELVSPELQAQLWEIRDKLKAILVISTEPFIPWELVHLKEPDKPLGEELRFLGQFGLVRWLHQAGYPPLQIHVGADRVRYVIPDYPDPRYALEDLKAERAFMESELAAKPIVPHLTEVRRALTSEPFDILHFACHGEAQLDSIQGSRMMLEGRIEGPNYIPEYLGPSAVEYNARLQQKDANRPLVFLNACQLGRTGYKLTGLGGFARAFLTAGAGAFAGALWSVEDRPASIFAKRFYKELQTGTKLCDATMRAREEARQQGDASWLSYAVYGHPLSVLKWS